MTDSVQPLNDAGATAHLIELFNNLSEPQQQALLSMLLDLVEKVETYYLNFLEWKKTAEFQPNYAEVLLASEKYQLGHYLVECVVKTITPDTSEYGEDRQPPQRKEHPRKSCLMLVDYATQDRAYRRVSETMSRFRNLSHYKRRG